MCFLPNSRASMDQAPGPIIAKVAPRIANVTEMRGLLECVRTFHVSTNAIRTPATGVQRPNNSSTPPAAPMIAGAMEADSDVWAKTTAAQ
jgi:hypothetical protein